MSDIKILDACCGSRMFWFDKNESHTTFMDIRQETFEIHGKKVNVKPDVIGDFRDMPFEDNTFNLVVFDPPHLKWAGEKSIMKAQSNWDVSVEYQKDDFEPTLDQDGGMFEPKYRLVMIAKPKKEILLDTPSKASSLSKDAAEIKKLFDFIKLNKENFFEKLGLKGVLEE